MSTCPSESHVYKLYQEISHVLFYISLYIDRMAECVKVIVRCRPMNDREKNLNCKCVLSMDTSRASCQIANPSDQKAPPKMFTFDGCYFLDSTTEQIYNDIAYNLVEVSNSCLSNLQSDAVRVSIYFLGFLVSPYPLP